MKRRIGFSLIVSYVIFSIIISAAHAEQSAEQILQATGVKGGLIVHIGCGGGRLTAALRANDSFLVHGLDTDQANIKKAREHIQSLNMYGKVSVEQLTGASLPYSDNLVNLVVAEKPGRVSTDEVMRVLCPNGAAYIKQDGRWIKKIKPRPKDIDEWSHFLHDASNNAVAADTQVGPPRRLKWICGPLWSRSHEFNSSLCAMVSANGRLFYIFDEGLTGVTASTTPERWVLTARDAFNGVLLWKLPMPKWGAGHWKNKALRSAPLTVPRLLVAKGERVFITLGYGEAVSALDAATGRILATYEQTEGTEEIRCLEDILLLRKGRNLLLAIDIKTDKKLWQATGKIQPLSLAAEGGKVFYQDGQELLCLRLTDGEELWRAPSKRAVSLLVAHENLVLLAAGPELQALSAETGKTIWTTKASVGRRELFVANGRIWHWQGNGIVGRDLGTGQITEKLNTDDVFTPGHHPRCYQSKATENFLITPNRGVEFVSVTGAENTQNDWVRGACRYGIMPGNGLLYVPPHPCFCYPGVKLTGFNALAPASAERQRPKAANRLQRGPAFGKIENYPQGNPNDWPTYRHDARRTGATSCDVGPQLHEQWQVRLQGKLTPPVVAADRVYVAAKDEHTLYSFGIENGRKLWQFTAAGRIDSPPSVHGELVLFGCADGRVYCLRASDGQLVWRFKAAPQEQRIIAFGQLESPWRVHGSVLLKDGAAYFTAGRSSYLDGGIYVFALETKTGKILHQARIDTWARTREDARGKPFVPAYHIEGVQSDILVSEGDYIYLGQVKFDLKLAKQEVPYIMPGAEKKEVVMDLMDQPFVVDMKSQQKYEKVQHDWQWRTHKGMMEDYQKRYGGASMGDRNMGLHVFSTSGFLDDSWFNRTFWMYSATWPGYYIAHRAPKTGQLLVVGPEKTYAVQVYTSRNLQSPLFTPGERGYLLYADDNDNEPTLADYTRGVPKGIGFTRKKGCIFCL